MIEEESTITYVGGKDTIFNGRNERNRCRREYLMNCKPVDDDLKRYIKYVLLTCGLLHLSPTSALVNCVSNRIYSIC